MRSVAHRYMPDGALPVLSAFRSAWRWLSYRVGCHVGNEGEDMSTVMNATG